MTGQPKGTEQARDDHPNGEEPRVVVRDRRRIDPQTGQVRPAGQAGADAPATGQPPTPAAEPPAAPAPAEPVVSDAAQRVQDELAERTADLQRLTAEYANYRKRVDRDREVAAASAKATLAGQLLSVLDDVERAEAHGDLNGAFRSVADKLVTTLQQAGLQPFGHEGEPFDPSVHEAVQHSTSSEVSEPTVTAVLRRGYRFGDRVVRAALVGVTDHEPASAPAEDGPDDQA